MFKRFKTCRPFNLSITTDTASWKKWLTKYRSHFDFYVTGRLFEIYYNQVSAVLPQNYLHNSNNSNFTHICIHQLKFKIFVLTLLHKNIYVSNFVSEQNYILFSLSIYCPIQLPILECLKYVDNSLQDVLSVEQAFPSSGTTSVN